MSRYLIASSPVIGHVLPASVLAERLVSEGHEVAWYTGAAFADIVRRTGAKHYPITHAGDFSLSHPHEVVPELREKTGIDQVRTAFTKLFIDNAAASLADLQKILVEFPADAVIGNNLMFADRWLSELGGPPSVRLGNTMYGLYSRDTAPFGPALLPKGGPIGRLRNKVMNAVHRRFIFRPVTAHLNEVRATLGLPPVERSVLDSFLSPYLYLQDCTESFEYPRSDLPAQVHFIGPLLPRAGAAFEKPEWWSELEGDRPVVLITQGTVRNEDCTLLSPVIEALQDEDVLIVTTVEGGGGAIVDPPENVRLAQWLPYADLMPLVSVFVTNGGYGGVQMALANGVPIVVCGATEDKPEVAARVEWSGTGVRIQQAEPTADQIRSAVREVLGHPAYRNNALRIATDISKHDAAGEAVVLLEKLVSTGRPVLRDGASAP